MGTNRMKQFESGKYVDKETKSNKMQPKYQLNVMKPEAFSLTLSFVFRIFCFSFTLSS